MEEITDSVSDSPLKALHKTMITAGYGDVPKDYNSFERTLTQQGEAGTKVRLQLHKRLVKDKLLTDVPEDYNTFASTLFKPVSKPQQQATAQSATQSAAPTVEQPSQPVQSQQQSASTEEQPSPSQDTTQMTTANPTIGYRRPTVGQRNADVAPSRLGVSLEDDRPTANAEQPTQSVPLPGRDRLWELAQRQADLGDRRSLATRVKDMANKGQLFSSSDPYSVTPSFNDAPMTAMGKVEAIRQARQRKAAQERMSDPEGLDKLVNATVDEAVRRAEKQSQDYDRAFGIAPTSAAAASEIAKGAHRQAVLESETDVNKLTEQVLEKMQPDIEVMRDTMLADGKSTDEVVTALNTYIGETVPNAVLNALRKRNAPKSTLDYVLGTAYNSWLSTALTNTIARNMRGGEQSYSLGGLSAAAELEEYGKSLEATKGKVASMAYGALGGGLGMITDPSNALSMMVGAGVFNAAKPILTKSASGLIARSTVTKGTQKATQQALMHLLPNTKTYQTAMKIGQSGASFAGFEVNSQLKADLNSGTFGGMDYAKAVGRGLVLGGATAGFGQVVDYGFKALGKGTKALSTKIGANERAANIMAGTEQIAGKVVVAPVVEAGVFTGGSMLLEDKPLGEYSASEIGDLYGSNLAFIIAMKGLNLPKTIVNSAIGPDAVPFFESVRHDIANPGKALERIGANINNIGDNALTDSEWREVNEVLGYDIRTLKGAVKSATEQNYKGKDIVNLYKGLSDVMTSDALTLQQKAVVSRMFGQQMKVMPVLGVKMEKDNDSGTYVVTALDPTGTAIRRLKYTNEQDAEASYNVLAKAANVNHMDILEASVANGYKGDGSDADPELPKKLWLKACAEAGYDGKLTARQLEAQGDPTTAGQGGRALARYKYMLAEMVSRKKHTSDADAVVETYDGKTHQVVETVVDEDGQHYICLDDDGRHIDIHESNVKNVASTPKTEEVLAADEASVLDGEVFGFSGEQTIEQLAQGQEAPMSYRECAYLAIKEARGTLTPEEAERCKAYTREQLDYYRSKYGYETEGEQRARIDEEAAKRAEQSAEAPTAEETPVEPAKTEAPTEEEVKPTEEAMPAEAEPKAEEVQTADQHKPLPSEVAEPKERAKTLLDEVNGDKDAAKEVVDKAIARAKKRLDDLDKAESEDEATDIANAKERQALKAEIDKWEQAKAELDEPTPEAVAEAVAEEVAPAAADGMVDELDALQAEVRNRQIATRIPSEVNEALQKLRVDVFGITDDENVNGLSSDGKIYVNVDRKSGKREVWIVGHEIGHIMDSRNPEAYSIVRKRANDWLRANVGEIGYAARVENVMSKYRQHIEDVLFDKYSASMSESAARARAVQESMDMVTREYIETEIANDILGDLIQNPETAKKMFKDAPSTASAKFFQAVRDFFRNLKERLYGTLGKRPERDINRVIRAYNDMYLKEVAKVMEDAEAVRGEKDIESETANYSIDTTFHAAGLRYVKDEQGKNRMFEDRGLLGEGKEIKPEDLTVEYMKKTPLGAIVQGAVKYGTMSQPQATKALENFLGIVKAIADTPDPEMFHALSTAIAYGSGYSSDPTKRDYYQLRPDGRLQFVPMKSNSEKQYNTTFDVTTICRKTQYIIDEISRQQKLLKRGLTPQEMVKVVYDTVYKTGEGNVLVPCPVCYVFNRWVNLGGVFNTMWRLDNKYRDVSIEAIQAERDELDKQFDEGGYHYMMDKESAKRYKENRDTMVNGKTKTAREAAAKYVKAYEEVRAKMKQLGLNGKIAHDRDRYDEFVEMSKNKELSSEEREQYNEWIKWMDDRRKAVVKESLKYADQRVFELESREIDNDIVTNQVLDLKAKLKTLNKGTKDYESTKNKIKDVQKKYKPLTDFELGELENLKQLQDIAGKMTWFDYVRLQDDYKPIEADVLFDINRSNDFKMKYPGAWKYRTTRGSGMGKAANAYSAEVVGSTVVAKGGKKIEGKHDPSVVANNIFALRDDNGNMRAVDENGELTPEAKILILQAIDNSAAQNYLSGQRLQSTSDYRTEYFTDYVLHLYQQAAIGSAAQGFAKVPESGKLFGDSGACVNLSLIAKGKGFHEVEGPEEDPNAIQDTDGKWYVLDFSDASGINQADAFNLIKAYDNIQGIIVAMSPKHARLCLRDPRVRFVIPYHISGDSFDLFNSKMATIGEDVATGDTGDFTKTQEDHISSNSAEKKMARGIVEKIKKGQKLKEEEYNLLATKGNMPKDMSKITTGEGAGSDSEYWMIRCLYMRFRGEDIDGSEARIPNNFLRPEDWGDNGFGNFDSQCRIKEWDPKTGEYTGKYKQIIMNGDQASLLMPNDFWDNLTVFEKEPREGYRDASVNNQQFFAWCETLGIRPRFSGRDKDGKKMYFTNAEGIKESYDLTGEKNYWQTLIDIPMYGNDGERYYQRPIDASKIGAQHMDENYTTNLETAEGTVQLHPMAGTPMEGSPMAQKITAAVRDRLLETNIKELDDFAKLIRRRRTTAVNKATKQGPQAQDWSGKEMKKVPGWLRTEWETDPTLRKAIADGTHREWFKQRFGDAVAKTTNEKVRKLLGIKGTEGPEDPDNPSGPKGGKPKAKAAEATSMAESDAPRYSILTEDNAKDDHERSVLKEFAEDKVVHVTRSMQEVLIDGVRYALPPMAAKVNGEYQTALRINDDGTLEPTVLKSDEFPDKVNDKGQFILDKGNGKKVPAAYNPYFHAAGMDNMMNDQFAEAQDRDNLITVEGVIPLSELTSGYKAGKAKDSVGLIPWKSGVIQGQLEGTRDVYLSRYFKGLRVIPDEEVAKNIYSKINGKIEAMPSNVVTKSVRGELEKLGVKFVETDNQGKLVGGPHEGDYYTWWYGPESASARWDGYRKQANNEGMSLEDWVKSTGREGNIQYYSTEEKKNATVANKTADKLGVKARTVREHEMPEAERTGRKAWVDEQTGEIVVDLDRVGDSNDVKSAVAHALADGKSLGEMFKGDALQSIYDAIGKGTDGKTSIAKLAVNNESGKAAKDWKKAVASARIAIKKATGIEFDNTDIEQLLYKEAQGKQGNPVIKAKQIAAGEDYKANHLFDGVARVPEGMVTSERVPRFSISTEGEGTTVSAAGDLDALRRRIRKSTKDELKANAELVRAYLKDRLSPAMATRFGKRKILKIANEIERATTLSKRSLQNAIDEAEMTIGDSEVKTALDAMMTVLNTPTMRVNSRKQQVANKVDADTVTFFADVKGILKDVRKNNLSEKEIEIRDMIKENEAEAERIRKEAGDQGRVLTDTELDTLASIVEENKQLEKERTAAREERRTIEEMLRGDDIQTATERLLQLQNNPNRTAAENRELAALPFRIRLTALQSKLLQYQNKKTLPDDSEAEARLQALKDLGNYDDVVEQYLNYMQATPRARRAARIQQQRELMYEIADITRQLNDILENGHEVYQRWVQNIASHDSALLTSAVAAVSNPKKAPLQPSQQTAAMEQARGQKYSVVKSFFHGFYDTFNHMTQMIEASALPKEGFMYNYFITDPDHGWNALQGRYKDMLYEYRKRVTDTMEQMIGKDEMNRYNDTERITLTLRDSEGNVLNQFEREYTIGQLLYEYLLSRMAKGKTRLEMMGFDETAQLEVEKALGSRYMDFGDWVSEELLNDLYQEQNKTYKRLNGINLGRVEHYFPFRYTREEISQPGNLVEEYVQSLTSGISSEKHRTDNNHAFDLTRDAMSLLDKTIENGCRQATFGEFNRDLSVLLSSAEFMNALKNRGHDLDKRWTEVCNIAAGIDKSVKDAELQNYINRMLSGSVIAFRINTALKQLLSAPAFMLEHGFDPQWQLDLAKTTIQQLALGTDSQTVKWCMDNLPLFRARWNDQNMGDIRMIDETLGTVSSKLRRGGKFNPSAIGQKVMDTSSKVTAAGMIPNRAIDMFTCAIGAKAQYDYSLRKYRNAIGAQLDILKANTPEENWNEAEARKSLDQWAHNKALMEAEQIYNESQQSSQGAYVSPLQRLGTNWARILTLFKTASLSYARKGIEGLVTSSRAARGLGAVEPIFIPGIGEQDQPFVMAGRGKYKGVRRATKAMEGLAQASMFLIGLGMAWNLGGLFTAGYAPVSAEEYINNITDDEANVTMTAALLSNSPLAESLIAAAGGQSKAQMSDALIIDYARKFKNATAAEGIKLGLQVAAQVGLGIKTDTWTNMLTGIDGMISDGTIDYTDIQFILNSPPSQGIYRTARAMEGERLKNGEIGMSQYISKMLFAKACNDVGEEGNWWDSRKDYKDSDIDKVLDAYRKRMYPSLAEYKAPADKDADIEEEKGKIEVYDTALKVMNTVRKAYVSRDPNAKEIADKAHALLMQLMDGSEEQAAHEDKLQQYRKAYLESLKIKREQGDAAYEEYMGANGIAVDKGNEYRALKAEITSALNSMLKGDISQEEAVGIIKAVREEIKNIE